MSHALLGTLDYDIDHVAAPYTALEAEAIAWLPGTFLTTGLRVEGLVRHSGL
jgi:hypothetical protein